MVTTATRALMIAEERERKLRAALGQVLRDLNARKDTARELADRAGGDGGWEADAQVYRATGNAYEIAADALKAALDAP